MIWQWNDSYIVKWTWRSSNYHWIGLVLFLSFFGFLIFTFFMVLTGLVQCSIWYWVNAQAHDCSIFFSFRINFTGLNCFWKTFQRFFLPYEKLCATEAPIGQVLEEKNQSKRLQRCTPKPNNTSHYITVIEWLMDRVYLHIQFIELDKSGVFHALISRVQLSVLFCSSEATLYTDGIKLIKVSALSI